jgi:2-polyprenyl-3-methyl-5-hydroxy-6-metoxy-1,4-benzoquinol methylase
MVHMDQIKADWMKEYQKKGIPSSFRKDPAKTVMEFISWLKSEGHLKRGRAADIGCGQGRNSFYLASQGYQVTSLELLEENVTLVNERARTNGLAVCAFAQNAADNWPIPPNSLDIVIDVFCYKHIVNKEKQAQYRKELWKALKPDGFYFISLASEQDGFYGPHLSTSPNPQEKLIIDSHSNIPSFLYSMHDLEEEFSDLFEDVQITEQVSTSPMYGQEYTRVVLNAIFKKHANLHG